MIKKIKHILALLDSIWSVPLAFLSFMAYGYFGSWFFGDSFGFYDPSFFQAAIYSALILVFFNGVSWGGMWFNFRAVYRYYITKSSEDFSNLAAWQKLLYILFLYCFFMVILTVLALKLV